MEGKRDPRTHEYLPRRGTPIGALAKLRWRLGGLPRNPEELQGSLLLLRTVRELGWHASFRGGARSVAGEPRPWITFGASRFLETLDTVHMDVLELGSGASTLWLAERFRRVRSIEHDAQWMPAGTLPANCEILLRPVEGDTEVTPWPNPYHEAGRHGGPWDLVIVDGMGRRTAAEHIDELVRPDGLVLLDDTDVPGSEPAQVALTRAGFGRIDFWGFRPGVALDTCTSVFSRDFNRWLLPARPV